jgi:sugar phosphate isomerase/epimerase
MGRQDVSAFQLAREIGLDGLQISVGKPPADIFLREAITQQKYNAASKDTGVAVASTAMGLLNNVPFMSEPKTALWTADSIEATRKLGTDIMLLAFFGQGELKAENKDDMRRTTESLMELAPRAEKAGVILGLETYLSAEDHLQILDQVKSEAVQVYYDVFNSHVTKGYDFAREIKLIGAKRICQVHLKEGRSLLGESGKVDWPGVAAALKEVGYKGWLILETQSPSGDVVADTRRNLEYVRKTFEVLA